MKMPDCNLAPKTLEGEGADVDSCAPGFYFVNEKENGEKLSKSEKHGIIKKLNRHEIQIIKTSSQTFRLPKGSQSPTEKKNPIIKDYFLEDSMFM